MCMQNQPSPPKTATKLWRPELVALPQLTLARRLFRRFAHGLIKLLVLVTMRATVTGMENFPRHGPALVVMNHLGDTDAVLLGASIPNMAEGMGKVELYDHWLVGPVFRAYGIIWIHQGRPDRKALRAALDALAEGRMVTIAPEGRQSVIGGLEEGTEGAAFLALRSGVPVVPVAMTGTENSNIYSHLKKWKRTPVTLSVGKPFFLSEHVQGDHQQMIREGTRQIMESLAALLPESYQGYYKVKSSE